MSEKQSLSSFAARSLAAKPFATTAAYVIRPSADLSGVGTAENTAWTPNTGTSVAAVLDDAIAQPTISSPATDDYAAFSGSGPLSYVGRLGATSGMSSGETVSSVTLWVLYAGQAGTVGSFSFSLLRADGSTLVASTADTSTAATIRWSSITFSGALAHSAVDALRFSLTASNTLNSWRVYAAYAVVNTTGLVGGLFDGPNQPYGDRNPPETLDQTQTTEPDAPVVAGVARNYVLATDGVPRTKTSGGLVSRSVTEAEYQRVVRVRPTIITAPLTTAANTNEQVIASATIPANTIVAGTAYKVKIAGTASQSSAAAATATARVRIGPSSGAVLSGAVAAVGAATTSAVTKTGIPFEIDCLVVFRAAGASGTAIGVANPSGPFWSGGAASAVAGVTSAVAAVGTVDMRMEVTLQGSSATVTATVQVGSFEALNP